MKLFTVFFKCQALGRRQISVQRVQRQRSILRPNLFSKREWMAPDKPVYQKKAETPTSIFPTGTICSRWQSKVLMNKKRATTIWLPHWFYHCCCALQNMAAVSELVSSGLTLVQRLPWLFFLRPAPCLLPLSVWQHPEQTHLETCLWILQSGFHLTERISVLLSTFIWSPLWFNLVT